MSLSDDGRRFLGTARYYARFRPGYPDDLYSEIVERFGLDGTGQLLDLGCGTGQLTLPLSRHFAIAFGMDPEPEMLAEAARRAQLEGVFNVQWIRGGSDTLQRNREHIGDVRLVTMGRSFHWMDGDQTLRDLADIVTPGGGIVICGDGCGVWFGDLPWQRAVRDVIQRWLGPERRAGEGTYAPPTESWDDVIARSPFTDAEWHHFEHTLCWTADEIIGFLYSTSFAAPPVLGNSVAEFERDIRAALDAVDPDGVFEETVKVDALFAWKRTSPAGPLS